MWAPPFATPADSARAVAHVYSLSLLACGPLLAAGLGVFFGRHAPSAVRALIWKGAAAALLFIYVGRLLPFSWLAWSVPDDLAAPLIALGRLQLSGASLAPNAAETSPLAERVVQALWFVYVSGAVLAMLPVFRSLLAGWRLAETATTVRDRRVEGLLQGAQQRIGMQRAVTIRVADAQVVPQTLGFLRPVILLPLAALEWSDGDLHATFLHELAHIQRLDVLAVLASRVACALYWFHPVSWWTAARLRVEMELACDDRVLATGVRASDYAQLLLMASNGLEPVASTALGGARRGLRARLAAIIEPRPRARVATWRQAALAAAVTMAVTLPVATVRMSPSRDALTTLLRDPRWESRAYAAAGLAQRRDSLEVARATAQLDPSPRVRAVARFALAQPMGRDLPTLIADQP
ncbi:MAG: M56 family metallopeptidase [Gemmatimonadaceae bacterium]